MSEAGEAPSGGGEAPEFAGLDREQVSLVARDKVLGFLDDQIGNLTRQFDGSEVITSTRSTNVRSGNAEVVVMVSVGLVPVDLERIDG